MVGDFCERGGQVATVATSQKGGAHRGSHPFCPGSLAKFRAPSFGFARLCWRTAGGSVGRPAPTHRRRVARLRWRTGLFERRVARLCWRTAGGSVGRPAPTHRRELRVFAGARGFLSGELRVFAGARAFLSGELRVFAYTLRVCPVAQWSTASVPEFGFGSSHSQPRS